MKKIFLFALVIATTLNVKAVEVVTSKTEPETHSTNGFQFNAGFAVDVEGDRYLQTKNVPQFARDFHTERTYGIVRLKADGLKDDDNADGYAEVQVKIDYEVEEGLFTVVKQAVQILRIQANKSANKVVDAAYFKIEGAHYVNAEILSYTNPGNLPDVELEVEVVTNSWKELTLNAIQGVTLTHQAPSAASSGNLVVNWSAVDDADYYELEWTYISNHGPVAGGADLTPSQIQLDANLFKNNSSRVEVKGLSYEVPLLYEQGYIMYRLRAVGNRLVNSQVAISKSDWTSLDGQYTNLQDFLSGTNNNAYLFSGHEPNLNWQGSVSFAEEGKHKAVVAYHDGSMRNRQAVTRINTDKRAVVAETMYDYNGRPLIQLLPAPSSESQIAKNELNFYDHFNLFENELDFVRKSTYVVTDEENTCSTTSPQFSTTTGASQYYSQANSFTDGDANVGNDVLNRDLIPDAKGYPYTQTQYTTDNTGRTKRQSGVGEAHKLTDHPYLPGRETKFMYAAPQQEELTRLFGNQVGYSVHYKKNSTVDPNGQVSVSYMNMGGKVIATSLAGTSSPTNVEGLGGVNGETIVSNLFGAGDAKNKLATNKLSKNLSTKFSNADAGKQYQFDYTAILQSYELECVDATNATQTFKFDGVANLSIQLVNGCGDVVFTESGSTVKGNTGNTQQIVKNRPVGLPQGEFHLVKRLSIDEEKLDEYWEEYLASGQNCLKTQDDFIAEEIDSISVLGCGLTCSTCQDEVNDIIARNPLITPDEHERLLKVCDNLCDDNIGCSNYIATLTGDMSINGQYALIRPQKATINVSTDIKYDENGDPYFPDIDVELKNSSSDPANAGFDPGNPADMVVDPSQFPLSIFNDENVLPLTALTKTIPARAGGGLFIQRADWRNPVQVNTPNYDGPNDRNQILYTSTVDDYDNINLSLTEYKDVNGNDYYVDVFVNNNVYQPEIITEGIPELVVVDAATGLYKVKVRYLKNVEDFEKHWQAHWGNYLIPYHPEFEYLIDCFNYQESHDFDYDLTAMNYATAVAEGLINASGEPLLVENDPIKVNNVVEGYLDHKVDFYIDDQGSNYSMAKMATRAANCPRGDANLLAPCGLSSCESEFITTDAEWSIYKAFYLSEKQKVMEHLAKQKAVDGYYYNGCISDDDFLFHPDAALFRKMQTVLPTNYNNCFGLGTTNSIINSWVCNNEVSTSPWWPWNKRMPAYLNPNQVCYVEKANRFENKVRRFYPTAPTNSGGVIAKTETETITVGTETLEIPVPSTQDLTDARLRNEADVLRGKFESCGLCPMASDVEDLLKNLGLQGLLTVTGGPTHVACPADAIQLGETLYQEIAQTDGDITLSTNITGAGKVMTVTLTEGGVNTNFVLTINSSDGDAVWSNIKAICCLSIANPQVGNNFVLKAKFTKDFGPISAIGGATFTRTKEYDVEILGTSDVNIVTCTIPDKCVVTKDAERVAEFLNALAAQDAGTGEKNSILNTTGSVEVLTANTESQAFYTSAVRSIIKRDNDFLVSNYIDEIEALDPKWSSSYGGGVLSGILDYTIPNNNSNYDPGYTELFAGSYDIEIQLSNLAETEYAQIVEFSNLLPVDGETYRNTGGVLNEGANSFQADVLLTTGQYKTVVVSMVNVTSKTTPEIKPVLCKEPIQAEQ